MKYKMSGKGDCNGRILQMADIRFSRQRPVTMMIRRRIYAQKCLNHPIKTIGKSVPGLTRIKDNNPKNAVGRVQEFSEQKIP